MRSERRTLPPARPQVGGWGARWALGGVGSVRRSAALHGAVPTCWAHPRLHVLLFCLTTAHLQFDGPQLLCSATLLSVQPPASSSWMPRWLTALNRWQPCRCALWVYLVSTGDPLARLVAKPGGCHSSVKHVPCVPRPAALPPTLPPSSHPFPPLPSSPLPCAPRQRSVEERSSKLHAAEERCYALEHEVEGLGQRLQAAGRALH